MLTFPLPPGVYVDESENLSFSVGRVATAVPVLLVGPSDKQSWWAAAGQPVILHSFGEYENAVRNPGRRRRSRAAVQGYVMGSPALRAANRPAQWPTLASASADSDTDGQEIDWSEPLAPALKAFFDNGGSFCYLCPSDQLSAVESLPDVTLVVQAGQAGTEETILQLCSPGSGLFALLDGPQHEGAFSADTLSAHLTTLSATESAALYYPWLTGNWPLRDANNQKITAIHPVAPSAVAAGLLCQNDRLTGPWKAPANLAVSRGLMPAVRVGDNAQALFTSTDFTEKSVNMFRSFSSRGVQLWGARTLTVGGNAWGYIQVRRTFDMVERDLQRSLAAALFEPNDRTTWSRIRATADNYLQTLMQQGAFAGSTPEESYRVEIGVGVTMSEADVLAGILRMRIALAVVRPAEFVVLEFSQQREAAAGGSGGVPVPVPEFMLAEQQLPTFITTIEDTHMGGNLACDNNCEGLVVSDDSSDGYRRVHHFSRAGGQWDIAGAAFSDSSFAGRQLSMSGNGSVFVVGYYAAEVSGCRTGNIVAVNREVPYKVGLRDEKTDWALGRDVAINAPGTIIAGSSYAYQVEGTAVGAIFLSYFQDGKWSDISPEACLTLGKDSPASENLGKALAFNAEGTLLVASAPGRNSSRGAVFTWKNENGNWQSCVSLEPPAASTGALKFGWNLALSKDGQVLAVGAPGDNSNDGAVYLYRWKEDRWDLQRCIPGAEGEGEQIGSSVKLYNNGKSIITGSRYGKNAAGEQVGAVWCYTATGQLQQKLLAHDGKKDYRFGEAIAVNFDGTRLAVGSPAFPPEEEGVGSGKVYLYEKED